MSDEPVKPPDLTELLKNRMESAFVALMPEAQFNQMVHETWEAFFKPRTESTGYSRETKQIPSRFDAMLTQQVEERMKALLKPALDQYFQEAWNTDDQARYLMTAIIEETAPQVMGAFVASLTQNLMRHVQNALSQNSLL